MRRLPPLRALEAFVRTVRLGSARAAASELGLSPSALSRRIGNLEEFTGRKLFSRTGQAVEAQSENLQLMRLRLGVLPLFGTQRLFPKLPDLRRLHPRLHIDIDTGPHPIDRVGDTLDAAIVITTDPGASFHRVQLDQNKVHAICSRDLVTRLGPEPNARALSEQTFLIHTDMPLSFEAWKYALGLRALQPAAIDHYDSGQLILEAAAQGLGIAIMHDDHLKRNNDPRLALLYDDVEVDSPYSYWFVCRPIDLESRPVRLFHDWLVEARL